MRLVSLAWRFASLAALASGSIFAAPQLRLANSALFVQVAVGAAAPSQNLDAYNIGDGSLSLTVSVAPGVTWMTAALGPGGYCAYNPAPVPCVPLLFTFNTAGLARGRYSGNVTVTDPQAIDAPQTVAVVVQVGASGPVAVDQYLAPGHTTDIQFSLLAPGDPVFCPPGCPYVTTSTQDGGPWLSLSTAGEGTLAFEYSYYIHLAPPASMPAGTYTGSFTINNSKDNRTIPVTMRVATQPIANPSASQIGLTLAENGPAAAYPFVSPIALTNSGMGALEVQSVTGSGTGVSAYEYAGLGFVTLDPGSFATGTYTDGSVTMDCNAANCPVQVPVSLTIVPQGPPVLNYQGVVNNATFDFADVAPGDVLIATGQQLSLSAPAYAGGTPLPTILGGASVLVNGAAAPMYYSSFGQIAFQLPSATPPGQVLIQVQRNGQAGNTISANVAPLAPRIAVVTDLAYNPNSAANPILPGATLILWCIGLGATNPAVPDGAPAPANPPALVTVAPTVQFFWNLFGEGAAVSPSFAGLSPGGVGLYQVMATVPGGTPPGIAYVELIYPNINSSFVPIFVQ